MAITYHDQERKRGDVTMTDCPQCGDPIRPGQGFAEHWSSTCSENPENIKEAALERLGAEPLTDDHGNWIVGGESMNDGDECWFVACFDLDRAPKRVVVEEVSCYSSQPEVTPDGAFVGEAKIAAVPSASRNGLAGRLVLGTVDPVVTEL